MKPVLAVVVPLVVLVALLPAISWTDDDGADDACAATTGRSGLGPNLGDAITRDLETSYSSEQLQNASTIISVGKQHGIPQRGWLIAMMTALVESGLRNLDHGHSDSVGLMQQRPSSGWGTAEQLQDPNYAVTAFYGKLPAQGAGGVPPGLTQIVGWQQMGAGEAAQQVQVSAVPDAYGEREGEAAALIAQLNNSDEQPVPPGCDPAEPDDGGACAWVNPVPKGWSVGATFRQIGSWTWMGWHTGFDFAIGIGSPVYAAAAGTVSEVNPHGANPRSSAWGNQVVIDHGRMSTDEGVRFVSTTYNHLHDFAVKPGDRVTAGQLVGHVGMTGNTFGPHLHFEVHDSPTPTFNWAAPAPDHFEDPWAWLNAHREGSGTCNSGDPGAGSVATKAIAAAKAELGVPYSFGGGTPSGPTVGITEPAGWDCSSYLQMAYFRASDGKINLPRTTYDQIDSSLVDLVSMKELQPGDLIFIKTDGSTWSHVVMWLGKGKIIEEPRTGKVSRIAPLSWYEGKTMAARRVVEA